MSTLLQTLTDYRTQKKALPAFNIDTFVVYQAVELAVKATNLPCIVQLSAGEDKFVEAERLYLLAKKAQIDGLPIFLNMDHGQDISRLKTTLSLGFDMVHFDGSTLDYQTNQILAKDLVEFAHYHHALVEVEFNHIIPVDSQKEIVQYTNPAQAAEFIALTHADLFAVSIGNRHGVGLKEEHLNLNVLDTIHQNLPETFLTLHGGSGINALEVSSAIKQGIQKININTDLRLQFKKSLAMSLSSLNTEKMYDYFQPVVDDLSQIIKQKLLSFSFS